MLICYVFYGKQTPHHMLLTLWWSLIYRVRLNYTAGVFYFQSNHRIWMIRHSNGKNKYSSWLFKDILKRFTLNIHDCVSINYLLYPYIVYIYILGLLYFLYLCLLSMRLETKKTTIKLAFMYIPMETLSSTFKATLSKFKQNLRKKQKRKKQKRKKFMEKVWRKFSDMLFWCPSP